MRRQTLDDRALWEITDYVPVIVDALRERLASLGALLALGERFEIPAVVEAEWARDYDRTRDALAFLAEP